MPATVAPTPTATPRDEFIAIQMMQKSSNFICEALFRIETGIEEVALNLFRSQWRLILFSNSCGFKVMTVSVVPASARVSVKQDLLQNSLCQSIIRLPYRPITLEQK